MVPVNGEPLLHKLAAQFRAEQVKEVVVVRGFGRDQVSAPDARFVDNEDFASTGELVSLSKAAAFLESSAIISFGDILFRRYILQNLILEDSDIAIVVDAAWQNRSQPRNFVDYIVASHPYSLKYVEEDVELREIGAHLKPEQVHGEWIGLMKTNANGAQRIREALAELETRPDFRQLRFDDLFRYLLAAGQSIRVLYITGHWLDVDSLDDLSAANAF